MAKEEDMQQRVILYQLLHKHLEELKQQASMLEARLMEFEVTKQALGDFKGIKDSEMLVPLGSGCYAHGRATNSKEILVNIGANLMLSKPVGETSGLLEERIGEIQGMAKELQDQMTNVINQITAIAGDLEQMQHSHK